MSTSDGHRIHDFLANFVGNLFQLIARLVLQVVGGLHIIQQARVLQVCHRAASFQPIDCLV